MGLALGFPKGFLWGVSASGFQFEMGDPSGDGLDPNTDWFAWVHDERNIKSGVVSGDLPENGVAYWKLYRQDHSLARRLGLNAYRIGIEWSRIFPKSTVDVSIEVERASDGGVALVNVDSKAIEKLGERACVAALKHYRAIIEDLKERGFKVIVCLNHFTLPLWIHNPIVARDTGLKRGPRGWVEETAIIEFVKYAAFMAHSLGDIVDMWATFNEPMAVAEAGYMFPQSGFPPSVNSFKAFKWAASNMAVAHARAYDAIKTHDTVKADADSSSPAYVGLIHNVIPAEPFSGDSSLDIEAASFMDNMHNHFFPRAIVRGWLDKNFKGVEEKGEVKDYLKHRLDWLGLNYYTRFVVKGRGNLLARIFAGIKAVPEIVPNYGFACQPNGTSADGRPSSDMGWEVYAEGLIKALKSMAVYEKPIYVTENGVADEKDAIRPDFIANHIEALERALNEEKIDVRGYFHWALTDNYEWAKGFKMKFGLFAVNLKTKERKMRKSAETFKEFVERHRE